MKTIPFIGYAGRALAVVGAGVLIVSLFVEFAKVEGTSYSLWAIHDRIDVLILVLGVMCVLLLVVSLFKFAEASLFSVAVIGGIGLGQFLYVFIEPYDPEWGPGAYLANLGPLAIICGTSLAFASDFVAGAGHRQGLAFFAEQPTQVVGRPAAGWYADPTEHARLRYWDGEGWTEDSKT